MPIYEFECKNGHEHEEFFRIADRPEYISCPCGLRADIRISKRQYTNTFKPYVENHITGKPIVIETAKQRDQLLKKHNLTYDKYSNIRRKYTPAVEGVTFDDIQRVTKNRKLDDGTPLESPQNIDPNVIPE